MREEKILIVDDNQEFLEELQVTLSLCGYTTKIVLQSGQTLQMVRRFKPDAILLDLRMPGASGFEVAQAIKSDKATADIPIIAMSGYFPVEDKSALLDMHSMGGRIKKPFGISDLITQIEEVLHHGEGNLESGDSLLQTETNNKRGA